MKVRISATIEEETDELLDGAMKSGKYRNKSHAIEDAIKNYFGRKKNGK